MKFHATVRFSSTKKCLGFVSTTLQKSLNIDDTNGVKVFRIVHSRSNVYLSLVSSMVKENGRKAELGLNRSYAAKLGLEDEGTVLVEPLDKVASCTSAWIEPLSVDDWEILELHADEVEMQLLDQIRVLWPGQVFPLWVDGSVCIFLKTVKIDPPNECAVLMPLTELYIKPKIDRNDANPLSGNDRISKPTDKSAQGSTVIPVDDLPEVKQSHSKFYRLYRNLRLKLFCRVYHLLKYLFLLMWRHLPHSFLHLRLLLFPSVDNALVSEVDLNSKAEWLSNKVASLPNDFKLVLRVEPVSFDYSSSTDSQPFLSNQPNTIFLLSNQTTDSNSNTYLVLLSKVSSPTEKLDENRQISKKAASAKMAAPEDTASVKKDVSGNINSKGSQQSMRKCVVRMYFHSRNKYAMISNWSKICGSYNVKVPSCVRRQMNLSVSSKVRIQKLPSLPQLSMNIKALSFDIISSEPPLPSTINFKEVVQSFEEWLGGVSNGQHPIPITQGTLLVFPITAMAGDEESAFNIEALVTEIQCKQKSSGDTDNIIESTYLLSIDDLSHIELNFSCSNRSDAVAFQSDVDIQLPDESLLVYGKGLEAEGNALERFIEIALDVRPLVGALLAPKATVRPTCVLVSGAKGTGKTVLCRSILRRFGSDPTLHAYVRWISCSQWRGKKPENVKRHCDNLLYELLWRQPAILLLDDLDYLTPSTGGVEEQSPDSAYTSQLGSVIKSFLQSLNGKTSSGWVETPRVAVIVTTKAKSSLHSCLTSAGTHLFSKVIDIELPDLCKREILLKSLVENFTDFCYPSDMNDVLEKTEGFAAADLLSVVRRSVHLFQQKKLLRAYSRELFFDDDTLKAGIFIEALSGFTPASLQNAKLHKPSPLTWKDVGGLNSVKQKLIEQLVWPVKYKHVFEECGLQAQSGVLLFGPPGCGKTLVASVVANECNLNFISIKGPEVLSKYIGASEAAVRDLFSRAKAAAPCVLFFDEFDSLAPRRGHDSTGVTDRVVNQLLTHLDGVEPLVGVTVMAASNRPDLLDPALLRPGRLDSLLYCPLPDVVERHEILTSLSRNLCLEQNVDLMQVAEVCESFSGADLKALLYNAQLDAVHETLHSSLGGSSSTVTGAMDALSPFSTISPTSHSSSKCLMEIDDLYHSNGYGSLEECDPVYASPLSSASTDHLKRTAAELIQSLQQLKSGDLAAGSRLTVSNSALNEALVVEDDMSSEGYISQLYLGRPGGASQDTTQLSNSICQSQASNAEMKHEARPQSPSLNLTGNDKGVHKNKASAKPTADHDQTISERSYSAAEDAFVSEHDTGSEIVYFPKLHQGRCESVPRDIVQLSNAICNARTSDIKIQEKTIPEKPTLSPTIEVRHINHALNATRPSISTKERKQLEMLYSSFVRSRERTDSSEKNYYEGTPRATLS